MVESGHRPGLQVKLGLQELVHRLGFSRKLEVNHKLKADRRLEVDRKRADHTVVNRTSEVGHTSYLVVKSRRQWPVLG